MDRPIISSKQNSQVKEWRKLHTGKGRRKAGYYIIEGYHLIEEADRAGADLDLIIIASDQVEIGRELGYLERYPYQEVSESVMADLALTQTPQGIMGLVKQPTSRQSDWRPQGSHYLMLDAIQDPGNLGTMIRTAHAAGYDGVILGEGTVDPYNDKAVRSSQGSLWHLDLVSLDLTEAIPRLQSAGIPVYATALNQQARDYRQVLTPGQATALILGNEGQGVNQQLLQLADQNIYIPMPGQAESLNVAVAAGILIFASV